MADDGIIGVLLTVKGRPEFVASMDEAQLKLAEVGAAGEKAGAGLATASAGATGFSTRLKSMGTGLKTMGAGLTRYVTAPIIAVGAAAVYSAFVYGKAAHQMENQTGKTGRALDRLNGIAGKIYAHLPVALLDISSDVALVSQRLDLSGRLLRGVAQQFAALQRIGAIDDVKTSVDLASKALNAFHVPSSGIKGDLDAIFRASQITGVGFDTLVSGIQSAQVPLQVLGFNLRQSAALIATLNKGGITASTALRGIVTGFSKFLTTTATAAQRHHPFQALQDLFEQIQKAPSLHAAQKIGLPAFGARGGQIISGLRSGAFNVHDLMNQINDPGAIGRTERNTRTTLQKLGVIGHHLERSLRPLGDIMIDVFKKDVLPVLRNIVSWVGKAVKWFQQLSPSTQKWLILIGGAVAVLGPVMAMVGAFAIALSALSLPMLAIGAGVAALAVLIALNWNRIKAISMAVWGVIGKYVMIIWHTIAKVIRGVLKEIVGVVNVFIAIFTGHWGAAWNGIKQIFSGIWKAVYGIMQGAMRMLSAVLTVGLHAITAVWGKVWGGMKSVVKSVWQSIVDTIRGGVNSVIGIVNWMIEKINGFQVHINIDPPGPGAIHFNWNGPNIPTIPLWGGGGGVAVAGAGPQTIPKPGGTVQKALGGAVRAGQWAWTGEHGPELVRFDQPGTVLPTQMSRPTQQVIQLVVDRRVIAEVALDGLSEKKARR